VHVHHTPKDACRCRCRSACSRALPATCVNRATIITNIGRSVSELDTGSEALAAAVGTLPSAVETLPHAPAPTPAPAPAPGKSEWAIAHMRRVRRMEAQARAKAQGVYTASGAYLALLCAWTWPDIERLLETDKSEAAYDWMFKWCAETGWGGLGLDPLDAPVAAAPLTPEEARALLDAPDAVAILA
jgi:hypothetical protein